MYRLTSIVAALCIPFAMAGPASAEIIEVELSTNIVFDPDAPVNLNGNTFRDLFGQSFGAPVGDSGQLDVTGRLTYDSAQAPFAIGNVVDTDGNPGAAGGYLNPILSFELDISGTLITADIPATNAASATAAAGILVQDGGSQIINPEFAPPAVQDVPGATPSGNYALVVDEFRTFTNAPGGGFIDFGLTDGFAFNLGGTQADEFPLTFDTDAGVLGISSVQILVVNDGSENFFDGVGLPDDPGLFDPTALSNNFFSIAFSLADTSFSGAGPVSDIEVVDTPPSEVSEPAAIGLLGLGWMALAGFRRRRT